MKQYSISLSVDETTLASKVTRYDVIPALQTKLRNQNDEVSRASYPPGGQATRIYHKGSRRAEMTESNQKRNEKEIKPLSLVRGGYEQHPS